MLNVQDLWTGNAVHCPDEHECYCKGYDICFESDEKYREYMDRKHRWHDLNGQVIELLNDAANLFKATDILALVDRLEKGESLDEAASGDKKADSSGEWQPVR